MGPQLQARSLTPHSCCHPPSTFISRAPPDPHRDGWAAGRGAPDSGSGQAGPGKAVRTRHWGPALNTAGRVDSQGGTRGSWRQLTLLASFAPPSLPLPLLCPLPSRRPGHGSDVTRRRWGGLAPTPGTVHPPTHAPLSELMHSMWLRSHPPTRRQHTRQSSPGTLQSVPSPHGSWELWTAFQPCRSAFSRIFENRKSVCCFQS